ncbi:MAG: N-acetylglucosamine-6-phosphate deacetylase [Ruminococcaceae bacterium]|nr:N-acetylglucosamine-6-phosphate deacetylase [Oscillospiraceae bacterium]
MLYKNCYVFGEDFTFKKGGFSVENGKFTEVFEGESGGEGIDLGGALVLPGLIDLHNHGNSSADFSDGDYHGLKTMAGYLAKNGITSFAPASMTLPYDTLSKAYATAVRLCDERPEGLSKLIGINMEGPFFSEKKKGAQNADYLKLPDYEAFKRLFDECRGLLNIVDVAPELEGAVEFIEKVSKIAAVSLAHTDASYDEAKAGIDAGATHLTHLFNAMPPLHHRKPGVIGAAAEDKRVTGVELICDGIHVHPSMVRLAFNIFGAERICLISDALSCCGVSDGEYMLGGQRVFVSGKTATLADGTLAGSATNLFDCMKKAIEFGISPADAVRAASYNPASELKALDSVGSIAAGKCADFVVCDEGFNLKEVYIDGKLVKQESE